MKVIIDGTIYCSAPSGGVYRYFNELIPRISNFPGTEIKIFTPKAPSGLPQGANISHTKDNLPSGAWLPEGQLKRFLRAQKKKLQSLLMKQSFSGLEQSVFHSTYYTPSPWNSIPQVVTVHDMISEIFQETFNLPHLKTLREAKAKSVATATRVIAISEQTKNDLHNIYQIPLSKIDVIYHGVDFDFFSRKLSKEAKHEILSKHSLNSPYFLYIGGRLHHKNFKRFLLAFANSLVSKDFKLAVAGAPWDAEENELIRKLQVREKLIWMPNLSDQELPTVYQNAIALALPSIYEGFGLPLIESMAAGCPVIASKSGPFPELAGEAALFFDPHDESQMENSMEEILKTAVREPLIELGKKRAQHFSWDKSAHQHFESYQKALEV